MFTKLKNREQGFTIIEVLIVLAIAGLIMLIVFLAVPALQRNQRNNARNSDAARIAASVTECIANRNNVTASCDQDAEIEQGEMSQLLTVLNAGAGTTTAARLQFSSICDAQGQNVVGTTNTRQFAVTYQLEPAVNRCIDSE